MVAPKTGNSIIRLPQKAVPAFTMRVALRGVVEISSFAIGKERLGPCLTALCQQQGIELNSIHLDRIAKVRLLGMQPSLETRSADGTAGNLFAGLQLQAFLTQDEALYILGDKRNIKPMAAEIGPDRIAGIIKSDVRLALEYRVPPLQITGQIREAEETIYPDHLIKKERFLADLIREILIKGNGASGVALIREVVNNRESPQSAALMGLLVFQIYMCGTYSNMFEQLKLVIADLSNANKGIAISGAQLIGHTQKLGTDVLAKELNITPEEVPEVLEGMAFFSQLMPSSK
ncbi:MAG: hypothetical protein WCW67_07690 [Candidatus Margulisiibacteriota bacterium]|jgi:hypothetical protein